MDRRSLLTLPVTKHSNSVVMLLPIHKIYQHYVSSFMLIPTGSTWAASASIKSTTEKRKLKEKRLFSPLQMKSITDQDQEMTCLDFCGVHQPFCFLWFVESCRLMICSFSCSVIEIFARSYRQCFVCAVLDIYLRKLRNYIANHIQMTPTPIYA